ncbi:MAG: hypothetical protein GPJ51_07655 [Candidatus Heimdallarchaeota archaeon]|nr:hypothetical protein [Candidatus Heimdallarchaeota archaeon]
MKKSIFVSIVVCLLIFLSGIIQTQSNFLNENNHFSIEESSTNFTSHEAIMITQDVNFTDYAFPGNGSSINPYIIENYNITTNDVIGINVEFTTKHFVIRNCYINASQRGINIEEVTVGTANIVNNTCIDNYFSGIRVYLSPLTTIINNTCIGSRDGIHVHSSSGVTISNNTCTDNYYHGIKLEHSYGAVITKNMCTDDGTAVFLDMSSGVILSDNLFFSNYGGISVYLSSDSTIINNTCTFHNYGIGLMRSTGTTLMNNTFANNERIDINLVNSGNSRIENNTLSGKGINLVADSIEEYRSYAIKNNTVDTKTLGYFLDLQNITLTDSKYGQLIFINCSDISVSNQDMSEAYKGLLLRWCRNATISNIICNDNFHYGIFLWNCSQITLENNICSNSNHGIRLDTSSEITLKSNYCTNNDYGIQMYATAAFVTKNTLSYNEKGIRVYLSNSSLFTFNQFKNNEGYGIYLDNGSNNNAIHHNSFIDNNQNGTSQAFDSGENNTWWDVNTKRGNHWSGWTKGVPYSIAGNANSIDPYPLNENLKRINYSFVIFIPVIVILTILQKYRRKKERIK